MNIDVMSKGVASRRLADKVCVVTGAAGGIGEATAERLASEGARVVGVDLLEHSVGELSLQADLTDLQLSKIREVFLSLIGVY